MVSPRTDSGNDAAEQPRKQRSGWTAADVDGRLGPASLADSDAISSPVAIRNA
jgi:hypothetical protein